MAKFLLVTLLSGLSVSAWASQDPTAPLGWQKPKQSQTAPKVVRYSVPSLQSIVCVDANQCRAILSGKVVVAGESVSGYRVSRIEPEVVTLTRGGKQWKLELFSLDIKN